jgi:hypothetical protein
MGDMERMEWVQRHCCGCDCADLDNSNVKCSYLMAQNMAAIASNEDLSIWQKWSQMLLKMRSITCH